MATVNLGSIKFKWKGTYAGGTAYTIDDVVSYNGSSYICIQASTGNLPTDTAYFEQMSSAGTNGTDGTDLTTTLTTQGDIVYRDASGLARLGAGTSGQVLQTNGTGANPSWGSVSSDYVKLATVDITSGVSSVAIDGNGSWIDNDVYGGYIFYIKHLSTSNDSSSSVVNFRINNSGSAYSSGNYYQMVKYVSGSSSTDTIGAQRIWNANEFGLSFNNMDSEESRSGYGKIELLSTGGNENGGSGAFTPNVLTDFWSHHSNSSSLYSYNTMGTLFDNNITTTGITLIPTGGNLDGGRIIVYGRKQ